jgi:hypothetical protein
MVRREAWEALERSSVLCVAGWLVARWFYFLLLFFTRSSSSSAKKRRTVSSSQKKSVGQRRSGQGGEAQCRRAAA